MAAPKNGVALLHAVRADDFQSAKDTLLRDPKCVNDLFNGRTALHIAVLMGCKNMASLLLEMGAAVNMPTQNRNASALMLAVDHDNNSLITRLIEWGADVNQAANERWMRNTPLHIAASLERTGPIHLLLLRGANTRAQNLEGETALDVAMKLHHKPNVILLREFGGLSHANVGLGIRSRILEFQMGDFVDHSGEIHLDAGAVWAVRRKQAALVEYLLDIDPCLIDVCDDDYWFLLHQAAWNGDNSMVGLLLDRGAQVDSCTRNRGYTPLHLAARRGHQPTVKLLLDRGANIYALTHRENTARMLAIGGNHKYVVRTIDEHRENDLRSNDWGRRHRFLSGARIREHKERKISLANYTLRERDEQDSSDEQFKQDGYNGYLSGIKPGFTDRKTFTHLITIWEDWCQTGEYKAPVKIAIVDTGLDLDNRDFKDQRVEAFVKGESGNLEARLAKDDIADQVSRVKGRLNLAKGIRKDKLDIHDLDGHGTRVAGIIMRLAPDADLYIARVCDGNVVSAEAKVQPTLEDVISAIDWAIENKVDIINLSLGFRKSSPKFSGILQKAKASGTLIMAAMPNTGNYGGSEPTWPASDFSTTIGIHSCKPGGTFPSEFTSPPAAGNPNFMVAGEAIIVHKFPYPTHIRSPSVAERFELAAGTSYATAIATSMVFLVLSFIRQGNCKGLRRKARKEGLDVLALLKDHYKMAAVLKEVARPTIGNYLWISPELLWMGFQPPVGGNGISKAGREYAWNIICKALD